MYSTSMYNQRNIDYNKDELQNIPRFMYTTTTESNNLDQNIPYNRDQKPLQNLITLLEEVLPLPDEEDVYQNSRSSSSPTSDLDETNGSTRASNKRKERKETCSSWSPLHPQLWTAIVNHIGAEEAMEFDIVLRKVRSRVKLAENEANLVAQHLRSICLDSSAELEIHKIPDISSLLERYPDFKSFDSKELSYLLIFTNSMRILAMLVNAKLHKGLLMIVCARVEGQGKTYITGSGQKRETQMRVLVYEKECGVLPIPRPPRKKIRLEKGESDVGLSILLNASHPEGK